MDQHVTTTEVPYYTSAPTIIPTPSTSSNLIYAQDAQYHVAYPPQQQQQQYMYNTMDSQNMIHPGPYPSIDFFYETPQPQQQQQQQPPQQDINYTTATAAPSYQIPTTNVSVTHHVMSFFFFPFNNSVCFIRQERQKEVQVQLNQVLTMTMFKISLMSYSILNSC